MSSSGSGVVRVLIVDDSPVVRRVFMNVLGSDPGIQVVGTAPNPFVARDLILQHKPDVVTLDMEMPRMDGLTFLKKIMAYHPVPVVVVSSLTHKGSSLALEALSLGAAEVLHKPDNEQAARAMVDRLVGVVKAAALVQVGSGRSKRPEEGGGLPPDPTMTAVAHKIVAIGASTGGTTAITEVLTRLPANTPGTVIVQHMPAGVTRAFADRLNSLCTMEVREARDGDQLRPGLALLAPGSHHMAVRKAGSIYSVHLVDAPPINYHRPSVDLTLKAVARTAGANAVGVILTGMGRDGAQGLLEMRQAGARTIAQDEATSIIYGMPKVAAELGGAEQVLALDKIGSGIVKQLVGATSGKAAA